MIKFDSDIEAYLETEEKEYVLKYLKPLLKQNKIVEARKVLADSEDEEIDYNNELQIRYFLLYHLKDNYFKGSNEIFPYELAELRGILSMSIPSWITTIRKGAFYLNEIPEIILHNNVRTIEPEAFSYCPLKKVVIPDGVDTIYSKTFYGCRNLESVVIPKSVKYIEGLAFCDCDSLKQVSVPKNTGVDINAFDKHTIIDRY